MRRRGEGMSSGNCPRMRGRKYGMRAWEKLTFMDCKSGGWRWRESRATNPERADILCLATSAAYARMPSRGANVRRSPKIQRLTVGGKSDGVNVFMLGLIPIQNRLWNRRRIPCALNCRPD